MAAILIIDDEPAILESLEMFLTEKGYQVLKADSGAEGTRLFGSANPAVVILDIRLPDASGLEVLQQIRRCQPAAKVIMITAYQDMDITIEAMKSGAFDFIHKPLDADEIEKSLERALQELAAEQEDGTEAAPARKPTADVIIGRSEKMLAIFKMIGMLCQNRVPVLIQGETGTGKELIARIIHRNSPCRHEPFVTMDCSAVVETLVESELFGYEKGAFTGASHTQKGKIETAASGSLFLDEIGELPLHVQGKFLGFLQRREFMRVGGHKSLKSSCRIIAATNRDLEAMVRHKRFREDLFYRLRVVSIQAPALRQRSEDIPLLVAHFLEKIRFELGIATLKLQPGVMERLMAYPWPGNVRELENTLMAAVVRAPGKILLLCEIDKMLNPASPLEPSRSEVSLPGMEKEHIARTLAAMDWNRTKTARILGISLPTLRSKIRKYGLARNDGAGVFIPPKA